MANSSNDELLSVLLKSWSHFAAEHHSCEIALSGGIDSMVLADLLCVLRDRRGLGLSAVHVHHGLRPEADDWADFCLSWCASREIPLRVEKVSVDPRSPLGPEAAAREARYRVLASPCSGSAISAALDKSRPAVLALAHHADDQTETFFQAALRGGGLRALSAMPEIRVFRGKTLWRPLLTVRRAQIADYARARSLPHVDDPSNQDPRYLRNWLRHVLLPQVGARIPDLHRRVGRTIAETQRSLNVLNEVGEADTAHCLFVNGALDVYRWLEFSPARRGEVLRRFVARHDLGTPSAHGIAEFSRQIAQNPQRHALWRLPRGAATAQYGCLWACKAGFFSPDDCLWLEAAKGLPAGDYAMRTVRAGDVLRTASGEKKVMRLLQEKKIPAFVRPFWPVAVDARDRCVAVAALRCDETLAVSGGLLPQSESLLPFLGNFAADGLSLKRFEHPTDVRVGTHG